jgi:hypothetical protein
MKALFRKSPLECWFPQPFRPNIVWRYQSNTRHLTTATEWKKPKDHPTEGQYRQLVRVLRVCRRDYLLGGLH